MCQNADSLLQGREEKLGGGFAGVHSSACVQQLVVPGVGTACCMSLPKNCLDGCQYPFSCMGTHGHLGFGSWWKQTFSLRAKREPISCKYTGVWVLFIPLASAVTLSSPVRGCGTEFVSSFLFFVLNMLLLIALGYRFCITRNRNYLFPFLHSCHRWCFAPSSPPSCVSHLNV